MKYRKHDWFNATARKPEYGIQAEVNGQWLHCSEGATPLIFRIESERDAKLAKLEAEAANGH